MCSQFNDLIKQSFVLFLIIGCHIIAANAQQTETGTIRGRVDDAASAVIIGVDVTAVGTDSTERKTQTNQSGEFSFNLAPGKYMLRVSSPGFAVYEKTEVNVVARRTQTLDVTLNVAIQEAQVTVGEEEAINTNPDANASATVLKEQDIEALPDNPAELEAALQALAGPGAGPSGGEISIDGFSGGKLPRRDTIREIRINQNPFSSEFDRLGLGRIEILTKPGTEKWTGENWSYPCKLEIFSTAPTAGRPSEICARHFSANRFQLPVVLVLAAAVKAAGIVGLGLKFNLVSKGNI